MSFSFLMAYLYTLGSFPRWYYFTFTIFRTLNPMTRNAENHSSPARPSGKRVGILEAACGPDRKFDPVAADAELANLPLIPLCNLPELHPRKVVVECLTTMAQARNFPKAQTANRIRLTDAIELADRFVKHMERSERLGTAAAERVVDLKPFRDVLVRAKVNAGAQENQGDVDLLRKLLELIDLTP